MVGAGMSDTGKTIQNFPYLNGFRLRRIKKGGARKRKNREKIFGGFVLRGGFAAAGELGVNRQVDFF